MVIREKTTVLLDQELVREIRAAAERAGRQDYEIVEDALRRYLSNHDGSAREALRRYLAGLATQSDLTDEAGMELAYTELHEARRERDKS